MMAGEVKATGKMVDQMGFAKKFGQTVIFTWENMQMVLNMERESWPNLTEPEGKVILQMINLFHLLTLMKPY